MATNKNQHYVPKCYLKAFTQNSEGKAINVYNIDRKKCIPMAPVKNQCSRDYFYGKDEKLENAIQFIERSYATTLKELIHLNQQISEKHKVILKRFWLLQYLRTEASSKRTIEMSNGLGEVAGISDEEFNMGVKDAVLLAMKTYADCMDNVDDLKICLIRNKTKLPFITSDDPAILTNRWHLNDDRTRFRSFGIRTCGNLLFLPLSPKIMCLAYDGDVYNITRKNGWASISNTNDLKSFNQLQFLNCRANIFLKDIQHASFVNESFEEVHSSRPASRHRINYAVLDYSDKDYSRYKVVEPGSDEDSGEAMMHSETIHFRPTSWPSIIRWRPNGTVYTNGTGMGYFRKHHILPEYEGVYKESARLRRKRA